VGFASHRGRVSIGAQQLILVPLQMMSLLLLTLLLSSCSSQ